MCRPIICTTTTSIFSKYSSSDRSGDFCLIFGMCRVYNQVYTEKNRKSPFVHFDTPNTRNGCDFDWIKESSAPATPVSGTTAPGGGVKLTSSPQNGRDSLWRIPSSRLPKNGTLKFRGVGEYILDTLPGCLSGTLQGCLTPFVVALDTPAYAAGANRFEGFRLIGAAVNGEISSRWR